MKKLLATFLLGFIGFYLYTAFAGVPFGESKMKVGKDYLETTVPKTGAVNTVTSIVVNYRGFDTLGEVTVLFLAATGLGAILFGMKGKPEDKHREPSSILTTGAKALFPIIVLLGAYIFIHGHLTPGGGFQGGTIIATGVLMLILGIKKFHANHALLSIMESLAGITFVVAGILGLAFGKTFLENILPLGTPGQVFSAGVIPIIYVAVGFKVGAELAGVLDTMMSTTRGEE